MVYQGQSQHQYVYNQFPPNFPQNVNRNIVQHPYRNLSHSNSAIASFTAKGLGDISKTLSTVDQVIKIVRSAAPIVHEYGPMVKNIPAMYRIVKAINQSGDENIEETESLNKEEQQVQETLMPGQSMPRLYI